MELTDHLNEVIRTSKFAHDFPESISTDSIKGFRQVIKSGVEVDVLFLAFLRTAAGV